MTEHKKYSKSDWTWKAAGVLILDKENNKILAFRRKKRNPGLGLPCGFVEPGEYEEQAAIRECYEETGYRIRICQDTPYVGTVNNITVTTFLAEIEGWQDNPLCPDEGTPEWHSLESFWKEAVFVDYNKAVLDHFGVS